MGKRHATKQTATKQRTMYQRDAINAQRWQGQALDAMMRAVERGDVDAIAHASQRAQEWADKEYAIIERTRVTDDPVYSACAAITIKSIRIAAIAGNPLVLRLISGREPDMLSDLMSETYIAVMDAVTCGRVVFELVESPTGRTRVNIVGERDNMRPIYRAALNYLHGMRKHDIILAKQRMSSKQEPVNDDIDIMIDQSVAYRIWCERDADARSAERARESIASIWSDLSDVDKRIMRCLASVVDVWSSDKRKYVERHMTIDQTARVCGVTPMTIRSAKKRFARMINNAKN